MTEQAQAIETGLEARKPRTLTGLVRYLQKRIKVPEPAIVAAAALAGLLLHN